VLSFSSTNTYVVLTLERMSSQPSDSSTANEKLELLRSSGNKIFSNDEWTSIPKKKRRKKLGLPNFSKAAPAYERHINSDCAGLPDQRIAYVSKILRSHEVNTILELGCGDLTNSIKYLKSVDQFTSLTAVDINPQEIKRGVIYSLGSSGKHSKVRLFIGDATVPCKE